MGTMRVVQPDEQSASEETVNMGVTDNDGEGKPSPPKNRRVNSKSGLDNPGSGVRGAGYGNAGQVRTRGDTSERPPGGSSKKSALIGGLVGVAVGAGAIGAISWAGSWRDRKPPPEAAMSASDVAGSSDTALTSNPDEAPPLPPSDANEPEVAEPEAPPPPPEEVKWQGPWLGAMAQMTPVYPTARFSKNRLGYLRRGAQVAAHKAPVVTESCKQGFYKLVDGGFVCGKYATLNVEDPRVKLGVKPPDIDGALPYRYAYNTAHGTPLYSEVPSREDMLKYEPYLEEQAKKKSAKDGGKAAPPEKVNSAKPQSKDGAPAPSVRTSKSASPTRDNEETPEESLEDSARVIEKADQPRPDSPNESAAPEAPGSTTAAKPSVAAAPSASAVVEPTDDDKPWWQKSAKDKPLDIKLSDLEESDGTLAKRMVKGFFIAIDRGFSWNNRMWWKTTDGLIAPSDRLIIPKTPELKGFDMSGGVSQVAFVRSASASKYEPKKEGKGFSKKGKATRFSSFALTTNTRTENKNRYYETADGFWLREADIAITEPGARPDRIGSEEKWVDVNLSRKTLVAMLGDKPMYAALISPGRTSTKKDKDHRTKTGMFRIREKHIATTMDGDGTTGGELPYSIMDVPYVEYYDGSYALHAAFWHNNFGREQSHGCVNLAPADAKWLFFWTEPALPKGWHGVWSSDRRLGSWVVIHE